MVSRLLLPPERYDDFAAVYAFCRRADDAADEQANPEAALGALRAIRQRLDACFGGAGSAALADDPHFPAIAEVIARRSLPRKPFDDLLDAFEQDQTIIRYATWGQVIGYCERSANPVGRLVLLVTDHGGRDDFAELARLSDATCTALQLTNLWQDIRRDLFDRDRIYVPADLLDEVGLDPAAFEAQVRTGEPDGRTDALLRALVDRTRPLFASGRSLWNRADPAVKPSLMLFTWGGEATLRAVAKRGGDVIRRRPAIGKARKAMLLATALLTARRRQRRRRSTADDTERRAGGDERERRID